MVLQNKAGKIFIALCVTAVVSLAAVLYLANNALVAVASTLDTQIKDTENALKQAKDSKNTIAAEMERNKVQLNKYEREIMLLDSEIDYMQRQDGLLQQLVGQLEDEKAENNKKIAELKMRMEAELVNFDNMLRMNYQYGDDTYFNIIFGSENISDFLSRMDMIDYHLKANNNVLESLEETRTELEAVTAKYESSVSSINEFNAERSVIRAELDTKLVESKNLRDKYQEDYNSSKAMYDSKTAELNSLQSKIDALYEERRKSNTVGVYNGQFMIPTKNHRISSGFAWRDSPISGKRELHNGLDFAAPYGTPIYAADDGYVFDSRYSSSWGNVIQIDHGGGITTLYAHASSRVATVGQNVKKGDIIAYVGSTGWSTGNHLHFTVYKNAVAVDPKSYLGM